ncbi:DUF2163 domain-containing protein [Aurantimonas sp. VKM B-3413]|uniref:DUF2163 domain-containing protein n=1 Tax=Aurantimonas sp. VKM B-3413 TaxID=2779401 RepID=UPI001E380607|nr:DUF2163 domain-containing protein [Aurantimonas sp. VKM B-3413]MCB8836092.1 DUF2163 domain-containing protein [Aurantimonas sp. VKM B-3413]
MKQLPPALAAATKGPATTLANCWRLTRRDGTVLGFTDHDAPLSFDGTLFAAATGLSASEAEEELGLAATTREVEGALSSAAIEEVDIFAGRYDGATVETFVVDWQNPAAHLRLDVAELGEVKRGETAFTAELRSIATRLDRVRGRLYRRRCDAVFGDARCGFPASTPPFTVEAVIFAATGASIETASDLGAAASAFSSGRLAVLAGQGAGLAADIVSAAESGLGTVRFFLAEAIEAGLAAGDRIKVTQGCDKSFETCRLRFSNSVNFRGFPHMPGADAALAVAKSDGVFDGSPVVP